MTRQTMFDRLRTYASFVRVSHSVFALPFALVGALLAARIEPLTLERVGWIVACMVTARSAAMGFNRIVFALPPADPDRVLPLMDRYAALAHKILSG